MWYGGNVRAVDPERFDDLLLCIFGNRYDVRRLGRGEPKHCLRV